MKKIIIGMMVVLGCLAGYSETQYKVYDITMSLQSTKAAGVTSTPCGDQYQYRVKQARKIKGVIAGCGCEAAAGDPTCLNFNAYFWDFTTGVPLTNVTWTTKVLQRIGKKGEQVEQVVQFDVTDQEGENFSIILSGIGIYKASKKDAKYDYINVSGNVAGWKDAPYWTTAPKSQCCGQSTPGSVDQTQALPVCENGACTASADSDVTPVYGSYTMKYNALKSSLCEKKGITFTVLGVPVYAQW